MLTVLFLIAYYRYLGLLAAVALATYAVISLATLQAIGAVLTLPGIAGFVLAIGMAVDGNVLVFERIKEEHTAGRTLRNSTRAGFSRAFTAIAGSNVTTLVAALLLYFFASGGVRGFGVTLSVGVLASMFTTLVITRVMTVVGYSVNDTVVIFDRIRERRRQWPKDTVSESANEDVLETLPRTINTGVSTLFILVSLWVLGGDTLADFALALIIGVVVGTYSSILTAMPLATVLERSAPGDTRKIRRTASAHNHAAVDSTESAIADEPEHSDLTTAQSKPPPAIPPRPRKERSHNRSR